MTPGNPLQARLRSGTFVHLAELGATVQASDDRLIATCRDLAGIDSIDAAGITNGTGGGPGRDPVQAAIVARDQGILPNVHLTCVHQDRKGLRKTLEQLHDLGIYNVLAITGDYPRERPDDALFDIDSIGLLSIIDEFRQGGAPFHVSVAVSPFKYSEPDQVYQYIKLEKKFAAGADFAITQVGHDARKFEELRRYLDERGITRPVIGSAYVLSRQMAEIMSEGRPPGCWVSPELLERVREETGAEDEGKAARLERAAGTVAVLRGLGYAGAYIGGTDDAGEIDWIIRRGEELAPRWTECAGRLRYPPKSAFYLFHGGQERAPKPLGLLPNVLNLAARLFPVGTTTIWRRILRNIFEWMDDRPRTEAALEKVEAMVKRPLFGCRSCGNCVLGDMEYVCPETCPKRIRNGPCGGADRGRCEVTPDRPCIFVKVYERAKAADELELLHVRIPPPDRSLEGASSWVNYFLDRDVRPGCRRRTVEYHEHA